uniref:NADH-ubiquinone oxidoreductase chain 4L n=1 Tax=Attagenus augustatus augustatus TaxID=2783534 RepID=A0A7U3NQU3_9COLE|nr:NADH dehydrogenase subunit 4L [Attagenus augustatus augustatus]
MVMLFSFSLFSYFSGLLSFCLSRKHLLLMLISLEFVVLSLFSMLFILFGLYEFSVYFSMIFVSMSVCESSLGLAILVSLVRTHGGDFFQVFSILW